MNCAFERYFHVLQLRECLRSNLRFVWNFSATRLIWTPSYNINLQNNFYPELAYKTWVSFICTSIAWNFGKSNTQSFTVLCNCFFFKKSLYTKADIVNSIVSLTAIETKAVIVMASLPWNMEIRDRGKNSMVTSITLVRLFCAFRDL